MQIDFNALVHTIQDTHFVLQQDAIKAVNKNLTIRNWLIGYYIVTFEQEGNDRAKYGDRLLHNIAESVNQKSLSYRNLRLFRQFYLLYPQIWQLAIAKLKGLDYGLNRSSLLLGNLLNQTENQLVEIWQSAIAKLGIDADFDYLEKLISRLSYTHLTLLLPINDSSKRRFYEVEAIKGNWSVSELKRQINSLYYERSGMSNRPELLSLSVQESAEHLRTEDIIKSPFTFEFLGLKAMDVVYESHLEQALIEHLQEFLLELGNGFCFEARQKRITIGDEYYFIDLVFYHRILRCHVLVELKMEEVKHEHIGQLKTYINYYKKEIALATDNPPIGILLVTAGNSALVEYAMADSDQALFVSKYQLELPKKEELQKFITNELKQL